MDMRYAIFDIGLTLIRKSRMLLKMCTDVQPETNLRDESASEDARFVCVRPYRMLRLWSRGRGRIS